MLKINPLGYKNDFNDNFYNDFNFLNISINGDFIEDLAGFALNDNRVYHDRFSEIEDFDTKYKFLIIDPKHPIDILPMNEKFAYDWLIINGSTEKPGKSYFYHEIDLSWIRSLVFQARFMKIPVYIKNLGSAWSTRNDCFHLDPEGSNIDSWPSDLKIREFPHFIPKSMIS